MSTLAHLSGILSSLVLAFLCFGPIAEVVSQARYLGWVFVVMTLMLLPALIIAMRYDYVNPVSEDS